MRPMVSKERPGTRSSAIRPSESGTRRLTIFRPPSETSIRTARAEIQARALVTRRMRPFRVGGRVVHEIGLPWHWGWQGSAHGDVVNNLTALVADPNVSIHEGKVFTCDVRAGKKGGTA